MMVVALLAACTAIDSIATGILLFGSPLPAALSGVAAAALHATAALLLAGSPPAPSSRRLLCMAGALAVPLAGPRGAAVALLPRGRGSAAMGRPLEARGREALTVGPMRRLGAALSSFAGLG